LGGDYACGVEGVVGCAAMSFVPAVGEFGAKAQTEFERRLQLDGVFSVEGAFGGAPGERSGSGGVSISADFPLQEGLQVGEGRLAVLILNQSVVGLDALKPSAEIEGVDAVSPGDFICRRE